MTTFRSSTRASRPAIVAVVAIAVAIAAACGDPRVAGEIEFRAPVTVRDVEAGEVEDLIVATGSLRAEEVSVLRTETPGELFSGRRENGSRLREGDFVRAGQVVAEVRGEDVRLAARTEATETRYQEAKRDYETRKELFEQGLISELEFRPTEAALADAKIEWERSRLTEARSKIVTPIAGVLLELGRIEIDNRPVADGTLVAQGAVVARVAPLGTLLAEVDVVGPDVARVVPGMVARVRHHAWDASSFPGRVARLAPQLDPATRTLRAEVAVDNRDRRLRPGMFVEVTMIAERREGVPVVSREAVADREGGKVVFVLQGQKVEQREVELGLGDDDRVEIRQGLALGERIVIRGLETLKDGARVRVTSS